MGFTDDELTDIYDKNEGYCDYCGKKLAFTNYGRRGERGAWEVDHSVPKSRGGTHYLRNLVPACIDCNRQKGTRFGRSIRASNNARSDARIDWGAIIVGGLVVAGVVYYITRPKEQYSI